MIGKHAWSRKNGECEHIKVVSTLFSKGSHKRSIFDIIDHVWIILKGIDQYIEQIKSV